MGIISNANASVINVIFGNPTILAPSTCYELDKFYSPERQPKGYICSNALCPNSAAKAAKEQSTLEREKMRMPTERRVCAVVYCGAGILLRMPANDQIG
jgi:hypothetical protein